MSKKPRRRHPQKPRLSPSQLVRPDDQARPAPIATPTPQVRVKTLTDLQEEYRYVVTDLKRIAIIAVVMLVVMIVLAFLLI